MALLGLAACLLAALPAGAAVTPAPATAPEKQTAPSAPAAPPPAKTDGAGFNCLRAKLADFKVFENSKIRQMLPSSQPIPVGDDSRIVIAGAIEDKDTKDPVVFRVFSSPETVRYDDQTKSFALPSVLYEEIPTQVTAVNANQAGETHEIHFISHDYDRDPTPKGAAPRRLDWTRLHTDRSVLYIACRKQDIVAWGFGPVATASRNVAKLWAAGFVAAVYLGGALFVYLRRAAAAAQQPDAQKLFRIETVKKWGFLKCLSPVAMTADVFDRGSLPKLQILGFTLLVAYNLIYLVLWEDQLFTLSTSIVYLLGIPALGSLGAQVANTTRDRLSAENWAWLVARHVLPLNDPGAGRGPQLSDLVMSESELDLYKLQALVFSVIVAINMMTAGPKGLGQFTVPDTLLQVLGLSQLVLVGGRFAKPATMGDIDGLLTDLRGRLAIVVRAATTGVDVDEAGKPLPAGVDAEGKPVNVPASPPNALPANLDAAEAKAPTAVKRYRDTAQQVQVLLEALSHRAVDNGPLLNPALTG